MNFEKLYFYWDETSANLIAMLVIGLLLGLAVFMVLDSAQDTPGTDLNLSELREHSRDNITCVPPYRHSDCYPAKNKTNNTFTDQECENGSKTYANQSSYLNDSDGVYCKL